MKTNYTIEEHWDPYRQITANSNAEEEFQKFSYHISLPQNQEDWSSCPWSLTDFEAYIDRLRTV